MLRHNVCLVHLESPASSTFEMQDIKALCGTVHYRNPERFVSVDNTWAGCLLVEPIALGVDLSLAAMTRCPSGASDLMVGAISANRRASVALLRRCKVVLGICGSDYSSCSVLKGLSGLSVRMVHRLCVYALTIAKFLEAVSGLVNARCSALPSFSYYCLRKRDYLLTNSVLSFVSDCFDGANRLQLARRFLNNLKVFGSGWSWGGCASLAAPVLLAHSAFTSDFGGPVVRLNVGLD